MNKRLLQTRFHLSHQKVTTLCIVGLLLFKSSASLSQGGVQWQLSNTVQGVQLYHAITECDGKKTVFIKFNNTNAYKVEVVWNEKFTTQKGKDEKGFKKGKKVSLPPGEMYEINCKEPEHEELVIYHHQVDPSYLADISKFDFESVTVTKVN